MPGVALGQEPGHYPQQPQNGGAMVKITDKSNYSRFARPASEDEGIWLDHVEVHLVTHPVGQVKEMHTLDGRGSESRSRGR